MLAYFSWIGADQSDVSEDEEDEADEQEEEEEHFVIQRNNWRCQCLFKVNKDARTMPKIVNFEHIHSNIHIFIYFRPMFYFYTSWKRQKTSGFWTSGFRPFLGSIEIEYWLKIC